MNTENASRHLYTISEAFSIVDRLYRPLMIVVIAAIGYTLTSAIYNIHFHPAKAYPGPWLAKISRLYFVYYRLLGTLDQKTRLLHEYYGPVCRIAPNELSYIDGAAWDDIYGFTTSKRPGPRLMKDPHFYIGAIAPNGEKTIGAANDQDHSRIRSVLAHAFSDRAIYSQAAILQENVDKLIAGLLETKGKPTNAIRWMHHITHDVVTHLAFGKSVNALENPGWDPHVRLFFDGIREGVCAVELMRYIPFKNLVLKALMLVFGASRLRNFNTTTGNVEKRMKDAESSNPDFISYILRANETEKQLTEREIMANMALVIDAGSETTASMLSGCLFNLTTNPDCLAKLSSTIRERFGNAKAINCRELAKVPYLNAIIEESMRVYMPVPCTLPRLTPPGGAQICGKYVPPNMIVGVNQFATYRTKDNWRQPNDFIPERWLGDPRFLSDKRFALQPFSTGARNCLGRNLAYNEMRLILAHIVWKFDLELSPESASWLSSQKSWAIWMKPDLMIKFKRKETR